jgi:hypothetical protein
LELIDDEVAERLHVHDFLIETNDFIKIESTKRILQILGKTHDCEIFESVDDIIKAYSYRYSEMEGFSLADRCRILAEGRPAIMRWVFAKEKINNVSP